MKENSYKFIWHKNEKYGKPIVRETWIRTTGGRQAAINFFMQVHGNLKKNTIEKAEEYTRQGTESFTPEVIKVGGRWIAA